MNPFVNSSSNESLMGEERGQFTEEERMPSEYDHVNVADDSDVGFIDDYDSPEIKSGGGGGGGSGRVREVGASIKTNPTSRTFGGGGGSDVDASLTSFLGRLDDSSSLFDISANARSIQQPKPTTPTVIAETMDEHFDNSGDGGGGGSDWMTQSEEYLARFLGRDGQQQKVMNGLKSRVSFSEDVILDNSILQPQQQQQRHQQQQQMRPALKRKTPTSSIMPTVPPTSASNFIGRTPTTNTDPSFSQELEGLDDTFRNNMVASEGKVFDESFQAAPQSIRGQTAPAHDRQHVASAGSSVTRTGNLGSLNSFLKRYDFAVDKSVDCVESSKPDDRYNVNRGSTVSTDAREAPKVVQNSISERIPPQSNPGGSRNGTSVVEQQGTQSFPLQTSPDSGKKRHSAPNAVIAALVQKAQQDVLNRSHVQQFQSQVGQSQQFPQRGGNQRAFSRASFAYGDSINGVSLPTPKPRQLTPRISEGSEHALPQSDSRSPATIVETGSQPSVFGNPQNVSVGGRPSIHGSALSSRERLDTIFSADNTPKTEANETFVNSAGGTRKMEVSGCETLANEEGSSTATAAGGGGSAVSAKNSQAAYTFNDCKFLLPFGNGVLPTGAADLLVGMTQFNDMGRRGGQPESFDLSSMMGNIQASHQASSSSSPVRNESMEYPKGPDLTVNDLSAPTASVLKPMTAGIQDDQGTELVEPVSVLGFSPRQSVSFQQRPYRQRLNDVGSVSSSSISQKLPTDKHTPVSRPSAGTGKPSARKGRGGLAKAAKERRRVDRVVESSLREELYDDGCVYEVDDEENQSRNQYYEADIGKEEDSTKENNIYAHEIEFEEENDDEEEDDIDEEREIDEEYEEIRRPRYKHNIPFVKHREPMSFRPTEATLKKRHHELDVVNAELVQLSKILGDKRHELRQREARLDAQEAEINLAQERLDVDVQTLLCKRMRARDEYLKKEVEAIIYEADSSVATLAKENRRLVSSNKELAVANRRLRDQVKLMVEAVDERDVRELESHTQIKQLKDRIERLKKNMTDMKTSNLVIERQKPPIQVSQNHNDRVNSAYKPKQFNVASQTTLAAATKDNKSSNSNPELLDLVSVLLRTHFMIQHAEPTKEAHMNNIIQEVLLHNSEELVQTLSQNLSILSQHADQQDSGLFSLFLAFVLYFVRVLPIPCMERHELAKSAFIVFQKSANKLNNHTRLSLQLIALSDFSQEKSQRCETMLTDLMNLMSSGDEAKTMFLALGGLDLMHPMLGSNETSPMVKLQASSVILSMCADGDWNDEFLDQCVANESLINSVASCVRKSIPQEYFGVYENILVLLQKISCIQQARSLISSRRELKEWIERICKTDDETSSEFMKLNAISILQNITEGE
ncbi:hypothetical protein BDR26DRAFT_857770 [Obelidium mucronatum]|nr:hypothetical protein BDR26DRAFT_857770 [Obelidium mucronatum]